MSAVDFGPPPALGAADLGVADLAAGFGDSAASAAGADALPAAGSADALGAPPPPAWARAAFSISSVLSFFFDMAVPTARPMGFERAEQAPRHRTVLRAQQLPDSRVD